MAAMAAATAGVRAQGTIDLRAVRIVDLTHAFDERTLYWPTSPSAFELKTLADGRTPGGFYYSSYALCTPEHGGTHLDAPVHFATAGRRAGDLPLEQLLGPAVVIDVTRQAEADARLDVKAPGVWAAVVLRLVHAPEKAARDVPPAPQIEDARDPAHVNVPG